MYEYKTVAAPMVLNAGKKETIDDAVNQFSNLINRECAGGWEYYSMETITIQAPAGCISFGKVNSTHCNMLIFRKQRS